MTSADTKQPTSSLVLTGVVAIPVGSAAMGELRGRAFVLQPTERLPAAVVRIHVPAERSALLRAVELGAPVQVTVRREHHGILVAEAIADAGPLRLPAGEGTVTVGLPVPPLVREDWPRRLVWGVRIASLMILALVAVSAVIGSTAMGTAAFAALLVTVAAGVAYDLRGRRTDGREMTALAQDAGDRLAAALDVPVPLAAMRTLLGAGQERTGNIWRPTRPRSPARGGVRWTDERGRGALHRDGRADPAAARRHRPAGRGAARRTPPEAAHPRPGLTRG